MLEDKITPVLEKDVTFWTAAHLPLPSPYVLPGVRRFHLRAILFPLVC